MTQETMTANNLISLPALHARTASVLEANGAGTKAASSVARALVLAQADGMGGHGLMRLATYAAQVRAGKVAGHAMPSVEQSFTGSLRIDAHHGFAYPALDLAVERLTALAPVQGIAMAGVFNSGHCGAMGLFAERLARTGLIAMMFANSPAAMAPWGGKRALFGTNPIACAFPYREDPVLIDLSLSKVARGHVVAARQKNLPIPAGWALDKDGNPTTDAQAALDGTMIPAGDAKGAALAMMVEALAAGATGANFAFNASSFLDAKGPAPGTGQLLLALAPAAVGGSLVHLTALFDEIAAEPGARLPGARRFATRREAERLGIAVQEGWFTA
jgi:(2R)-3-sulfolactate dehydrogenase (NADP+)